MQNLNQIRTQMACENYAWGVRYQCAIIDRGETPIERGNMDYDQYEDALAQQYFAGTNVRYLDCSYKSARP